MNDAPQSLNGCSNGPGESCKDSDMSAWLETRAQVVGEYDAACQPDYGNSTNVLGIYSS